MRLVDKESGIEVEFLENTICILSIENKNAYARIMENIWNQVEGREGCLILSDTEKEIPFSKNATVIFNPFSVNCNEKRILTKLYQEIKEIADEQFPEKMAEVLADNISLIDNLIENQEFGLEYKLDFNILDMLKLFDVRLKESDEDILVRITDYLKLLSRICHIRLFIFAGLRNYFSDEDLEKLYQEIYNEKVYLLDVEPKYEYALPGERIWILDKDMCIINI